MRRAKIFVYKDKLLQLIISHHPNICCLVCLHKQPFILSHLWVLTARQYGECCLEKWLAVNSPKQMLGQLLPLQVLHKSFGLRSPAGSTFLPSIILRILRIVCLLTGSLSSSGWSGTHYENSLASNYCHSSGSVRWEMESALVQVHCPRSAGWDSCS